MHASLRRLAFVCACASIASFPLAARADESSPPTDAVVSVLHTLNRTLKPDVRRLYAATLLSDTARFGVDPSLVVALVSVESGWNRRALSWCGAIGLGQLMPATARRLRVDPSDVRENLRGTTMYLHELLARFHEGARPRLAIAGYNAGELAVERYHDIPPYAETQNYVRKVLATWKDVRARLILVAMTLHPAKPRTVGGSDADVSIGDALDADGAERFWIESDAPAASDDTAPPEPHSTESSATLAWDDAALRRRVRSIIGGRALVELDFDANARALVDAYLADRRSRESFERVRVLP